MSYNCVHCGRQLTTVPEPDADDWVIRCLACGARNVITSALKLVGWRD
jgi:DNA-directed RNA polymerase subunit RPC12/RpoP